MELEQPTTEFQPVVDRRPRMPEPLPVKLVAIEDVRLHAPAGIEPQLDLFYSGILGLQRLPSESLPAYRAENFTIRFCIDEHPIHDSMRAQCILIPSLSEAERKLLGAEIEYARHRGVNPGRESLLLLDPAGNWVELVEIRVFS